jgi:hypothetical protein
MAGCSLLTPVQTNSDRPTNTWLTRLRGITGLDRAIGFTLLARGWAALAGVGTLALITKFLTPAEQGYYYTFYSLVALQIVFELGFSVVILQSASHEAAHLTLNPDGTITGPVITHARLASVLQKSVRWYMGAAILMGAVLLPAGIFFFSRQTAAHPSANAVAWFGPWILIGIATCITFQIDPAFSFLEGCGYVPEVARVRLGQAIAGTCIGWLTLFLHRGLYAPGLMLLGQAIVGLCFLYTRRRLLGPLLKYPADDHRIDWGAEIWPFQWRIAVSWIAGYFIFQFFNPILFAYRSPVEAGQMGMSLTICGTLSSMAIAWMNTKAAPFGKMVARREFTQLDRIFFRSLVQSTAAAALASTAVWATLVLLRTYHVAFALRILPPAPLAMLLLATVCNIVVFGQAVYLRAHKQEKFMPIFILAALWTVPAALVLGRLYGAAGIALEYLCGTIVISLGLGTFTFLKFRRIWHGGQPAASGSRDRNSRESHSPQRYKK